MNMIAKLDKRNWVEFKIGDIFSVKRGKRIVRDIDYFTYKTGEYKYPVITSTTVNNGVDGYYNKSNCPKNTLVCGGEASGMFTTYQEEECWVMDRARILTPKNNILMNKYVGLFLATILKQNQYKYCYGRSANPDDIENLIVQLPAKNNLPDYKYMESYIRSLWGGSLKTSVPYSKVQFNISLWKEYTIGDLFHLVNCKCSNASQLEDGDDLNYIGAKKNNNGIIKRVKYENDLTTKGNCIIFICDGQGSIGFNNYMDEDFIGSTTLMAGYNKNLNKYNGLFITSILDLERPKFSFGRKRKKTLAQSAIKLPSLNNEPDWKYMENYIKKLQYSDLI